MGVSHTADMVSFAEGLSLPKGTRKRLVESCLKKVAYDCTSCQRKYSHVCNPKLCKWNRRLVAEESDSTAIGSQWETKEHEANRPQMSIEVKAAQEEELLHKGRHCPAIIPSFAPGSCPRPATPARQQSISHSVSSCHLKWAL